MYVHVYIHIHIIVIICLFVVHLLEPELFGAIVCCYFVFGAIIITIIIITIIIIVITIIITMWLPCHSEEAPDALRAPEDRSICKHISGGRLCTLIGVPWRGVGFSTLSTGRFVLKQHICKGAESAEHAETAGYTYEGTQTTA